MKILNFKHKQLEIDTLQILPGEIWAVYGGNNSGVDTFVNLCEGKLTEYSAQVLQLPSHLGIVSFELQQEIFEEELRNDDTDFIGHADPGTLVSEFIPDFHEHEQLLEAFAMSKCLNLGYRQLSSGQSRKLLLLKEITSGATTLLLQNPYDGLDRQSRLELEQVLALLAEREISIILTLCSIGDIPSCSTHLAVVEQNHLHSTGKIAETGHLLDSETTAFSRPPAPFFINDTKQIGTEQDSEELILLSKGFARYGENLLFQDLHLSIKRGDHTLITGPNGCGKSTLLEIISGDNSNCYANNLQVFGKKRGTGESIWELKKQMGLVSPALHRDHRIPGTTLAIILSGLYDSIGLYEKVQKTDIDKGIHLLNWLGLADKQKVAFRKLSFSEQRLVLIGRGLIKQPELLLLDEPTHGLDDRNRYKLLYLLEDIAEKQLSTIVYVSHREDEFRPFFTNQIKLDSYAP